MPVTVVAYRGNFRPSASTESHVAASLEALGHSVIRIQEDVIDWPTTVDSCGDADVFLWTSTFGMAETWAREDAWNAVHKLNNLLPTVAYHLDLFWGLDREEQITTVPWFKLRHVFTTDNLHEKWAEVGINHHYLPPAVYHAEAHEGYPRPKYTSDIAFVGSWRAYAHEEHWPVREAMLNAVRRKYGRRFKCWPQRSAIRGGELTDLYASVKVVVGDSCLAGQVDGYFSDRVSETTGRGGFLIHPYVPGILDTHPSLVTYPAGDWDALIDKIDYYLANPEDRELNRKENAEYTRSHNTYMARMQTVLDTVL